MNGDARNEHAVISQPSRPALECLYLVVRSLDPTGRVSERWMNRWKPALSDFAITFEGRLFPIDNLQMPEPVTPLFGSVSVEVVADVGHEVVAVVREWRGTEADNDKRRRIIRRPEEGGCGRVRRRGLNGLDVLR